MGTGPSSVDFSVPPAPESRALTPSPKKSTELGPARSHDHALRPSIARFAIAPVSFCPYSSPIPNSHDHTWDVKECRCCVATRAAARPRLAEVRLVTF